MARWSRLLVLVLLVVGAGVTAPGASVADASLPGSTVTLTPTAPTVVIGSTATLSGTLVMGDGSSPAGLPIDISETRPDSSTVDLGPVTTGPDGSFTTGPTAALAQPGTYTFTASYAGDVGHTGSQAVATVDSQLATSTLTLNAGKTTLAPGVATNLLGTLALSDSGSTTGQMVALAERRPDGSTVSLPAAAVAADGTFFYGPTEHMTELGVYTFTARYDGDTTHSGSQAVATVTSRKIGARATLRVGKTNVTPGMATNLLGSLTFSDETSTAGRRVGLTERRPNRTTRTLPSVAIRSDGTFLWGPTEHLTEVGVYTFIVHYLGDTQHSGAAAVATVRVAKITTTAALGTSVTRLFYGHVVTLTADVSGAPTGGLVVIHRTVNGKPSVAAQGHLNSDGIYRAVARPSENTLYWVTYAGDAAHGGSHSTIHKILVGPILAGSLSPSYARSGPYQLYHYQAACAKSGASCPIFSVHFIPANPGHMVYAVIQVYAGGQWRDAGTLGAETGPNSVAAINIRYPDASFIGYNLRVFAVYPSGPRFAGVIYGTWYLRITH